MHCCDKKESKPMTEKIEFLEGEGFRVRIISSTRRDEFFNVSQVSIEEFKDWLTSRIMEYGKSQRREGFEASREKIRYDVQHREPTVGGAPKIWNETQECNKYNSHQHFEDMRELEKNNQKARGDGN